MITGGSTANLAIILVDARTGVITQTRRHTFLVSLLGIDWGYGFDAPANQTGKSGSQIHFMMGQQF